MKCHRCAMTLSGEWPAYPLRLWGIFRLPAKGLVIEPKGAVSRRCRHCGWINIFDRVVAEITTESVDIPAHVA